MLAFKSKIAFAVLLGTISFGTAWTQAQQLPSQRYQPVQNDATNSIPPSVHVPPAQVRQLSAPSNGNYSQPRFEDPAGNQDASYNFSDSPLTQRQTNGSAMQGNYQTAQRNERGTVMQTSYEVDQNGEPVVPDILAATLKQPVAPKSNSQQAPMITDQAVPMVTPTRNPDQFAAQMQQLRSNSPRIAPQDFAGSNAIRQEMADFQNQVLNKTQANSSPVASQTRSNVQTAAAAQLEIEKSAAKKQAEILAATNQSNTYQSPAQQRPIATTFNSSAVNATTIQAAPAKNASTNQIRPEVGTVGIDEEVSATEFISRINADNQSTAQPATQNPQLAPKLVAQHINSAPATMTVPKQEDSVPDINVRTVSNETETPQLATINLSTPAIEVETFGPQTVGINKPAIYKVIVKNGGSAKAEQILIGINLPAWVDIENVNLTSGGKEVTDGKTQARLVWRLDQVPGNSTQTITITAVPRKAEAFDLGVEWTLVPRTGAANIQVTQPRLEMHIAGPGEVQFGEQAVYHVTVRNPGTGTAENVTVMLPEALGGERASLGNIGPGKDKNFQVELLARTAGELNLIATAVAEGNLEVSADRKLIVRRANLGIGIKGPTLKYAGSPGQYIVTISNSGDAVANDIVAAMALPTGIKYLAGIESVKLIEGGLRWPVGSLDPGQSREYKLNCQLDTSGDLQLEVGVQGKGDLQAASACLTKVETIADLVLSVRDPKGPLPTGQDTVYEISIRNRGSRVAKGVNLVMQFSEGIEPKNAEGLEHRIMPGQVLFSPISQLDPGQELTFKVGAEALKSGTHIFRAQLTCEESDSREIAEGTTRFFGDDIAAARQNTADGKSEVGGSQDFGSQFKR